MTSPIDPDIKAARVTAIVLAAAMFMVGLDSTVLVTALPRMARDFGVPPTSLSSSITIYLLVSTALMPMSSWIGQQFGPRRIFAGAIVGFTLASIGCGLAPSLPALLIARALQAAFASMMVPVGNLVLLKITPKSYLVAAMAISSTPSLIAPVVGPPIGGFITTVLDWPWVFFINAPIGLIGVIAARRYIPRLPAAPRIPFDFRGFAITACALCALIVGLDRLGGHGADWRVGGAILALGVVLTLLAGRHARRAAHPIVPLGPMRHPCFFTATIGAGTFVRIAFTAHGFVLPLMLQIGLGLSPFQAGLLLLATNGGDLVLKPVCGKALRRWGFRSMLVSGAVLLAGSLAACALLGPAIPFAGLFAILFVVGMCRSTLFTALMTLRFADMPPAELGGAQVLGNLVNSMGQATAISGAALLLNLLSPGLHAPDLGAFRIAMLVLAAIAAAGAPLFARLSRNAGAEVTGRIVVESDAMGQME
ncbi:MFS transporter [Sphingomonas sp. MMS24-J13]|uniref:MFS transporter n=1 Tax=Sphingomonas sp. MMS24-J13 TaxID=3238686 RepID=UPI00384D9FAF